MSTGVIHRVFNFSAGPAVLPLTVLEQARDEMLSLNGSGMSILEVSHRDTIFTDILATTKRTLRQLLAIPDDYEILFLQGGSRLQFAMIPMNLAPQRRKSAYLVSGTWGKAAFDEAQKVTSSFCVWDGKEGNYSRLPASSDWSLPADASYLHITSNETIQGVQFPAEPATGQTPLVCDASSDFLSRPLPIAKYGLLYACAQKNAGPAGVTVVILRKSLMERCSETLPDVLNFKTHADNDSLFNTPPTFAIYVVNLVCKWLQKEIGGLERMRQINRQKASMLYEVIDGSQGFYQGHAAKECRSAMNVTFRLDSDELQQAFLKKAEAQELLGLKGHRSVGGIRASIYNAMPIQGVERLRDHMLEFHEQHANTR